MAITTANDVEYKQVTDYLAPSELGKLRVAFSQSAGQISEKMRNFLPDIYLRSQPYGTAINDIFYGPLPSDVETTRVALSAADRERCVIALLASRGQRFNLALHIYLALMIGVSPEEIANIILLAGVYSGVENFADGLKVEAATLWLLGRQVNSGDPTAMEAGPIFAALSAHLW